MSDKSLRRFKTDLEKTEEFIVNWINKPLERTEQEIAVILMATAELLDSKSELMEYLLEAQVEVEGVSFNLYSALERREYLNALLEIAKLAGSQANFDLLKTYYLELDEEVENVLSNVMILPDTDTDTDNEDEEEKEDTEDELPGGPPNDLIKEGEDKPEGR